MSETVTINKIQCTGKHEHDFFNQNRTDENKTSQYFHTFCIEFTAD